MNLLSKIKNMHKIWLVFVILFSVVTMGCPVTEPKEDEEDNENVPSLTFTIFAEKDEFYSYTFDAKELATIDWGDGRITDVMGGGRRYWVSYPQTGHYTITFYADMLYLAFYANMLEIDVSKSSSLLRLTIINGRVSCLDVSNNNALFSLNINGCNFSTETLNMLFETLHDNQSTYPKSIYIRNNPGTAGADKSIAERKGWTVYSQE